MSYHTYVHFPVGIRFICYSPSPQFENGLIEYINNNVDKIMDVCMGYLFLYSTMK